jgi:hypothetical protein
MTGLNIVFSQFFQANTWAEPQTWRQPLPFKFFLIHIYLKVKVPRNRPEGPERVRGIALLFLDLGARRGWVVSTTPRRFTPGKDPVPIVQGAGWAPGALWTCTKNLAATGIRSPDRPARSQSLYRLSYPGPLHIHLSPYHSKLHCLT